MYRYDIINALIKKNKYKNYLEIGVRDNHCFNKIKIKDKSGVDPMQDDWEIAKGEKVGWDGDKVPVKYRITSDEYFEKHKTKYDIIFIDGLHENEQVYRDIQNSLKCLNKGGTILMHDCLPQKEEHQSVPRVSDYWNGDVWKAFVRVRSERKDVEMSVIETDTGVGIITFDKKDKPAIEEEPTLDWENYVKNKKEWMNIKSVDYFVLDTGEEFFINKRVQTFLHSGCLGDVIWSLPFIISKGGGDIYLRNHNKLSATNQNYKGLFRILVCQPYINKVHLYPIEFGEKDINTDTGVINTQAEVKYKPDIELDFDLDYFRISPHLGKEHLITSYFTANSSKPQPLPLPYLVVDENYKFTHKELQRKVVIPKGKFNVFHITQRYRCEYDWGKLIKKQEHPNYFIGLKEEYEEIVKDYDVAKELKHIKTADMYDMAILIKKSDKFFCNPSVGHCLAVGMTKEYFLVKNPKQGGVKTNLPFETIINE